MIRVLTIDFDIMLWKSMPLYNHLVPGADWPQLLNDFSLLNHIEFDTEIYEKITKMILRLSKSIKKENIHFVINHQAVLKYLPINDTIELTNIDQHHDIQYNKDEPNDFLNCGNWVKYAYTHNYNIINYKWVSNTNSIDCEFDLNHRYCSDRIPINVYDYSQYDYDVLIICLSPSWVPPVYRPLYYTWINMLESVYNTRFSVDG